MTTLSDRSPVAWGPGRWATARAGLLVAVLVTAGSLPASAQQSLLDTAAWLSGCWEARSGQSVTTEIWTPPAGGLMVGGSRTVVAGTARAFEHLRIHEEGERMVYVAVPSGQAETAFTSVATSDTLLVFENLAHDFPQRILYRRHGPDSVAARVEGPAPDGSTRGFDIPMGRVGCVPG